MDASATRLKFRPANKEACKLDPKAHAWWRSFSVVPSNARCHHVTDTAFARANRRNVFAQAASTERKTDGCARCNADDGQVSISFPSEAHSTTALMAMDAMPKKRDKSPTGSLRIQPGCQGLPLGIASYFLVFMARSLWRSKAGTSKEEAGRYLHAVARVPTARR